MPIRRFKSVIHNIRAARKVTSPPPRDSLFKAEKVFCIGLGKTGTTSLERALTDLGYQLGDQVNAEALLPAYAIRNFKPIVEFCLTADAFQDAPFAYPFTYMALDQSFPNAKFILSVRDNAEQWYRSLIRFHGNLFANGRIPTKEDLMSWHNPNVWKANRILLNTPEDNLYHKPSLISYYERHNADVRDYFRHKSNFLEINVSNNGAYVDFCRFLGKAPAAENFPRLNVSSPLIDEEEKKI
ncbi:MAG TPA: sulfotransferase [Pyrinomonadaceae bacterium]|nr:sulfotransferase [Pyrinomonadaceae bacterium]